MDSNLPFIAHIVRKMAIEQLTDRHISWQNTHLMSCAVEKKMIFDVKIQRAR